MKKFKKLLLTLLITSIASTTAFAKSGFEATLNVPLGIGIGFDGLYSIKDNSKHTPLKPALDFNAGVTLQSGYMIHTSERTALSMLLEIGYSHSTFPYTDPNNSKSTISFVYENLQVGILPKFNIDAFSIGLGAGVKIPFAGTQFEKNSDGSITKSEIKLDDILNKTISPVIPYVKLAFDYSIFFNDLTALNVGVYVGYDFGLSPKADETFNYHYFGAFDVGAEIGFRFGPKSVGSR